MSDPGQFRGSHAFTNILPVENESINPNTGSLYFVRSLAKLRGVNASIDLNLHLTYYAGSGGTFGLPNGWSFDIPHLIPGSSLTVHGRTYVIDSNWLDSQGHASGLKYLNNHGIKFEPVMPSQPLPSGQPGQYAYKMRHANGEIDYFNEVGLLLEHQDLFGNYQYYSYVWADGQDVRSSQLRLDCIQDSWGQKILFRYEPGSKILLTLPDGGETIVDISSIGVHAITDSAGNKTRFEYIDFNDTQRVISQITYPTGLLSRFTYLSMPTGASYYLPAVEDHYYMDDANNICQHTSYGFGSISGGRNFTGAAIGLGLGRSTDSLMDGDGEASTYRYDVIKTSHDDAGKPLARTCTWYNNFHLAIQEERFVMNSQGDFTEAFMTAFTYQIDLDKHARTTNYNHPTDEERFHNTSSEAEPTYQPLTRKEFQYNEFGNPTLTAEYMLTAKSEYVKQKSSTMEYTTTKHQTQLLKKSTMRDELAQTEFYTMNDVTEDEKNLASTLTSFRSGTGSQEAFMPWKQYSYTYDDRGRTLTETLSWSQEASVPSGSVSSVTMKKEYAYEAGIHTCTEFDPSDNAKTTQYDVRKASGPVVSKRLPLGQTETFEYDITGRLLRCTDARGAQTQFAYTVGPGNNSKKTTSALGYVKRTTFDVMGREVEVSDNGDPTISVSANAVRILSRKSYDCMSRLTQSTDHLGLTTSHTYDALDRPLQITDPQQNAVFHYHDDKLLTTKQTLNGAVRSVLYLDAHQRPVRTVKFPDSSDAETSHCLVEDCTYDGSERIVKRVFSQCDGPSQRDTEVTALKEDVQVYGPESSVLSRTTTGFKDNKVDKVTRQFILDLFGNEYTYLKTTTYANGNTFRHTGPVNLYNKNNRLETVRNQLGQQEHNIYNANGWLSKSVRFDGTETTHSYNETAHVTKTVRPTSTAEFAYDAEGRLCRVQEADKTIQYQFSLDGTPTGVIYGDNRSHVRVLDQYSRAVEEVDVFGVKRETVFNEFGNISRRSCKGDIVAYEYGTVNHTRGTLVGSHLSGARSYANQIAYDGFGRMRQKKVLDPQSRTLLDTTYQLDGRGQLKTLKTLSEESPELNEERNFLYDGVGQLIQDSSKSATQSITKYAYDGNFNIVHVETDGSAKRMTYNAIDQRADPGFEYDTNGRMVKDDSGQKYSFDEQDHLISVQPSGEMPSRFSYGADHFLGEHQKGDERTKIYHDAGHISALATISSATKQPESHTSLFSDAESLVATYTDANDNAYFLDRLGSTALLLKQEQKVSMTYTAYGAQSASSAIETRSSFGFSQEFTDQASGLVYLRSRFYNPKQMSFMSMDTYPVENKYAYCQGDPVNLVDPTGHLPEGFWKAVAVVASLAIGAAVTAGVSALFTGAAAGAAVAGGAVGAAAGATGAAAGAVSSSALFAGSIAGGIAGGIAGSVSHGFFTSRATGQKYGWADLGFDVGVGAFTGLISGASGWYWSGSSLKDILLKGFVGSGGGAFVSSAVESYRQDRSFDWHRVIHATAMGAATGAVSSWGGKRYGPAVRDRFLPAARNRLGRFTASVGQELRDFFSGRYGPVVNTGIEMPVF